MEAFSGIRVVVQPRRKIPLAATGTPKGLSVDSGGDEGDHPHDDQAHAGPIPIRKFGEYRVQNSYYKQR